MNNFLDVNKSSQARENSRGQKHANNLDEGGYFLSNQPSAIQEVSSYQEEDDQSNFKHSSDDINGKRRGIDSLKNSQLDSEIPHAGTFSDKLKMNKHEAQEQQDQEVIENSGSEIIAKEPLEQESQVEQTDNSVQNSPYPRNQSRSYHIIEPEKSVSIHQSPQQDTQKHKEEESDHQQQIENEYQNNVEHSYFAEKINQQIITIFDSHPDKWSKCLLQTQLFDFKTRRQRRHQKLKKRFLGEDSTEELKDEEVDQIIHGDDPIPNQSDVYQENDSELVEINQDIMQEIKVKKYEQARESLSSRVGRRPEPVEITHKLKTMLPQRQLTKEIEKELGSGSHINDTTPDKTNPLQQSNSSFPQSSFTKQSSLRSQEKRFTQCVTGAMQWSSQVDQLSQKPSGRIIQIQSTQREQLQRNDTGGSNKFASCLSSHQNSIQSSSNISSTINNNHLKQWPKSGQHNTRIRIGGPVGFQGRKLQSPLEIQQQRARIEQQQQQQQQQQPLDSSKVQQQQPEVILANMQNMQSNIDKQNEMLKYQRKLRFFEDLNCQRLQQSPYAAHLNFKTFENFFDVEICGEKEQTGKTTYKLKRINPQKRFLSQQQQQMLMWMWQQNQQSGDHQSQVVGDRETHENTVSKSLPEEGEEEPVEKEMILAEGAQTQDTMNDYKIPRNGMMRNQSQPILSGNTNQPHRHIKTAENSKRRLIINEQHQLFRDPNNMHTQSQGFLPPQIVQQNGLRRVGSTGSDNFQKGNQMARTIPTQPFTNRISTPNQASMFQSQNGNFQKNFKLNQHMFAKNHNFFPQEQSKNENDQYNYTIDLAQLNHQQIRNCQTSQAKTRSIIQKQPIDGVNHNFINNNINININHNFTPNSVGSSASSDLRAIQQPFSSNPAAKTDNINSNSLPQSMMNQTSAKNQQQINSNNLMNGYKTTQSLSAAQQQQYINRPMTQGQGSRELLRRNVYNSQSNQEIQQITKSQQSLNVK